MNSRSKYKTKQREILLDYFKRADETLKHVHTPHLLHEALSFHERFLETGSMAK